jgi:hypothetical protein
MKAKILIILTLFFFIACKKDPIPQIIEPKDYFPVYPKSWWKYIINDTLINTDSVSQKYILHSYKTSCIPEEYSDPAYVPFFNNVPIYGYEKMERVSPAFYNGLLYTKWPILSENVGYGFARSWVDPRTPHSCEYVVVKQKMYNGKDSVLILEGYWLYYIMPSLPKISYQEYVKGVGLVYELIIDTTNFDTIFSKRLIDYYINN